MLPLSAFLTLLLYLFHLLLKWSVVLPIYSLLHVYISTDKSISYDAINTMVYLVKLVNSLVIFMLLQT